jgi:hypothetical protein
MMKRALLISAAVCGMALAGARAATITTWTFENVTTPSTGSGTASLVGGTSATFAAGDGGGQGWNTTDYASQSTGSGTRGVQFSVSTVGFEDITLSYRHRSSDTASRWAMVQYSLDGTIWTDFQNNGGTLSPHDNFYTFNFDFSSISGADNNANFGVRIVSIFSPQAFDQNSNLADFGANAAYMRANADAKFPAGTGAGTGDYGGGGTWRFDNVTIGGTAVPEPGGGAMLLALAGTVVLWVRRRW